MNTMQLECMINCDELMKDKIVGIFAADQIPKIVRNRPMGFICNTENHFENGAHWIAFFINEERRGIFFDSFAHSPDYYSRHFLKFFEHNAISLEINQKRLQSENSSVCGQYCIFILSLLCREYDLTNIHDFFSDNHQANDIFVFNVIGKTYSHCI